MALIQVQTFTLPAGAVQFVWPLMNAGDEGVPIQVWAYPILSWQLTGAPAGDPATNPNIPVMLDRVVDIYGSNDPGIAYCFGRLFSLLADPVRMNARTGDPIRDGSADQRFVWIKPVARGTPNPAGGDCGVLLLGAKLLT